MSNLEKIAVNGVAGSIAAGSVKRRFHNVARKHLRNVATKVLKLDKLDYDLRSNKAGQAVSGEITLHTDSLYIQVSSPWLGSPENVAVLVRNCDSRKDYCGKRNHFCAAQVLEDPPAFEEWLSRRMLVPYDADRFGWNQADRHFQSVVSFL